jgi:hypothetical protein
MGPISTPCALSKGLASIKVHLLLQLLFHGAGTCQTDSDKRHRTCDAAGARGGWGRGATCGAIASRGGSFPSHASEIWCQVAH